MAVVRYVNNVNSFDNWTSFRTKNRNGVIVDVLRGDVVDLSDSQIAKLSMLFVLGDPGSDVDGEVPVFQTVPTFEALNALTGMIAGDIRLVLSDETNDGKISLYGYDGTAWSSLSAQPSGNSRILTWFDGGYVPAEFRSDVSLPREFVGPVDPSTIGDIVVVPGDRWTPSEEA